MKNSVPKRLQKTLEIRNTKKYGNGVYALCDIQKGHRLHTMSGKTTTIKKIADKITKGGEEPNDPFQVGRMTYIDLDEFSRTFNHSCNPNLGIRKRSELFALRDIKAGEQLTYDYSMTVAPTPWEMSCACGSNRCRKVIGHVGTIPKSVVDGYLIQGAIQTYMRPVLKLVRAKKYVIPRYEILAMERIKLATQ